MRSLVIVIAAVAALAGSTGVASAVMAPAPQQTHPSISPRHGGAQTTFATTFTARSTTSGTLSAQGRAATSLMSRYSVVARLDDSTPPTTCTATVTQTVPSTVAGHHVKVHLRPTSAWCSGHYVVTVMLARHVACGSPPTAGDAVACPAIAFAPLTTGTTSFDVG